MTQDVSNEKLRQIINEVNEKIRNDPEIQKRMKELSRELSTLTAEDLHKQINHIDIMPKDVFDTPNKIEYYLKRCHNVCLFNLDGLCYHGVIFTSYKCTEYTPPDSDEELNPQ